MTDVSSLSFPDNFLQLIKDACGRLGEGVNNEAIYIRFLAPTDPNGAIGIQGDEWVPTEWEMNGSGTMEPTNAVYTCTVQHVLKMQNEEEGNILHRKIAKSIRLMLYRDPELQLALRSLSELTEDGRRERFQGLKVLGQRFASNNIENKLFFLSQTEFSVTTESL